MQEEPAKRMKANLGGRLKNCLELQKMKEKFNGSFLPMPNIFGN